MNHVRWRGRVNERGSVKGEEAGELEIARAQHKARGEHAVRNLGSCLLVSLVGGSNHRHVGSTKKMGRRGHVPTVASSLPSQVALRATISRY